MALLGLSYLGFFWETTAILDFEGWSFMGFIAFIAGPIVLLFATNLIIAMPDGDGDDSGLDDHYFEQSSRFFVLLIGVQAWLVSLDVLFDSVDYVTYLTIGIAAVFVGLILSKNYRLHIAGVTIVGLTFVSRLILQAL